MLRKQQLVPLNLLYLKCWCSSEERPLASKCAIAAHGPRSGLLAYRAPNAETLQWQPRPGGKSQANRRLSRRMSDVYLVLEAMFYREKQRLGDPGSKTVRLTQSCYRGEGIEKGSFSHSEYHFLNFKRGYNSYLTRLFWGIK